MLTVVSSLVPALTHTSGMVPNPSLTLSSSSSTVSWVAVKLKVLAVSPALNVTLDGVE